MHNQLIGAANYPFNSELFDSSVFEQVFSRYGTYLLPTPQPSGAGLEPSYPPTSVIVTAGAATLMKAFFDEAYVLPDPVVPSADGRSLEPYQGSEALTIGGELNKMVGNDAYARLWRTGHYRSCSVAAIQLGRRSH